MEVRSSAYGIVIFILSYVHAKLTVLMGSSTYLHVMGLSLSKNTLVKGLFFSYFFVPLTLKTFWKFLL